MRTKYKLLLMHLVVYLLTSLRLHLVFIKARLILRPYTVQKVDNKPDNAKLDEFSLGRVISQ